METKFLISEKLLSQWHPIKNEGIDWHQLSYGSYEYIWWVCSKGHEWGATIRERYTKNLECRECLKEERALMRANKSVEYKSLIEADPELALQWHPTRNLKNKPDQIQAKEDWPRRWWKCKRGHEWEETVKNRLHNAKSVCVYCSDKEVYEENSLATVNPEIASEWCPYGNTNSPEDVLYHSSEEAQWICKEGHVWLEKVRSRVKSQSGCPECLRISNTLYAKYPEIAKEWHDVRNSILFSRSKRTTKDIPYTAYDNVWWICKNCGREYTARVRDRVNGSGCRVCSLTTHDKTH